MDDFDQSGKAPGSSVLAQNLALRFRQPVDEWTVASAGFVLIGAGVLLVVGAVCLMIFAPTPSSSLDSITVWSLMVLGVVLAVAGLAFYLRAAVAYHAWADEFDEPETS